MKNSGNYSAQVEAFTAVTVLNQCHLVKLMTNNKDCVYIS